MSRFELHPGDRVAIALKNTDWDDCNLIVDYDGSGYYTVYQASPHSFTTQELRGRSESYHWGFINNDDVIINVIPKDLYPGDLDCDVDFSAFLLGLEE